jgi:hypothetical protein
MSRDDDLMAGDEPDPEGEVDPDLVPTVIAASVVRRPDPLDRAQTALRAARLARGEDPDAPDEEPDPPRLDNRSADPFARALSALERAEATRAEAAHGPAALARENQARLELQRLKGGGGRAPKESGADGAEGKGKADAPAKKPRKRRL